MINNRKKYNSLVFYFLKIFLPENDREVLLQNFIELYNEIKNSKGKVYTYLWLIFQIIKSIPGLYSDKLYRSSLMFKNYLKIAFRNMKRNKTYSFINIMGLTLGLTTALLILLFVQYELNYDKQSKNSQELYRIALEWKNNDLNSDWAASTWPRLAPAMKEEFQEIVKATRVKKDEVAVKYGNLVFNEKRVYFVDQDYLDMFGFELAAGDINTALSEPLSILISEDMAEKYLGSHDYADKTFEISAWPYTKKLTYTITGILKNIPENTHFEFDFLISYNSLYSVYRGGKDHIETWGYLDPPAYVQLMKNFSPDRIEQKLPDLLAKHKSEKTSKEVFVHLQPITSIHLHGNLGFELEANSDIRNVYLFGMIAFLIMLIACSNYMNLSIARSTKRSTEVGMRKIAGARRSQLIKQYIGESVLYVLISLIISIVLIKLILPFYNGFVERNLTFNLLDNPVLFIVLICLAVFIGLISGSYPALYLSSLKPVSVIKGAMKVGSKRSSIFQNSLVVFQFVISIFLIVSTLVVYYQLDFIKNISLGYEKDHTIVVHSKDRSLNANYDPLKVELKKNPNIKEVSASLDIPTTIRRWNSMKLDKLNPDESISVNYTFVDYDYAELYQFEFLNGRNFSEKFSTDVDNAMIINESLAKRMNDGDPLGKQYFIEGKDWTVIGIVKDFYFKPLHETIKPLVIWLHHKQSSTEYFSLKIAPENINSTLTYIENSLKKMSPDYAYELTFLDDRIDRKYRDEQKMSKSFRYFSIIALSLACLGLIGLTSYTAEQRRKEIGVRKVLGASGKGIILLLSRDLARCIVIANLISVPLSYFWLNKWLQNFAYSIDLSINFFIFSALILLLITAITVCFQSIRSAYMNPVDSLRYE